ncbi:hypothetical protein NCC49_005646 [Naganishia albida]|nr:hypothetical protein NCC49_005646 [Naganishia albida]
MGLGSKLFRRFTKTFPSEPVRPDDKNRMQYFEKILKMLAEVDKNPHQDFVREECFGIMKDAAQRRVEDLVREQPELSGFQAEPASQTAKGFLIQLKEDIKKLAQVDVHDDPPKDELQPLLAIAYAAEALCEHHQHFLSTKVSRGSKTCTICTAEESDARTLDGTTLRTSFATSFSGAPTL